MKNIYKALVAICMAAIMIALCACDTAPQGSQSSPSSSGSSSSSSSEASSSEVQSSSSEASSSEVQSSSSEASSSEIQSSSSEPSFSLAKEITGEKISMEDELFGNFGMGRDIGTAEELEAWYSVIGSYKEEVCNIKVCNMGSTASTMSPENVTAMLELLADAKLELYEAVENPSTGGIICVFAYDQEGQLIWSVGFNGQWLIVDLDGTVSVFNGENTKLLELENYA